MTDPDSPAPAAPSAPTPQTPQSPRGTLPAFAPVPRLKQRSNGWTPAVQCAFIEALADTGSVSSACRAVGRADHGAYLLRRHPEAREFREGNGRTQLYFVRLLGLRAGHPFRSEAIEKDAFLHAMIESFHGRLDALVDELERMLA